MIIRLLAHQRIRIIMEGVVVGNITTLNRIKDRTGMAKVLRKIWISALAISWREGLAIESEMTTIRCFVDNTKAINQCFMVTVAKDL